VRNEGYELWDGKWLMPYWAVDAFYIRGHNISWFSFFVGSKFVDLIFLKDLNMLNCLFRGRFNFVGQYSYETDENEWPTNISGLTNCIFSRPIIILTNNDRYWVFLKK
jgi:hypothetical protein